MITLKEIAKRCGVSTATISNVVSGKMKVSETTRQKVMAVINEVGYQPNYFAQGIRKKKTQTIGIIAEDIEEFSTPPMVESIMAHCEEQNYRTVLINMRLYDRWGSSWYDDKEKIDSILGPSIRELLSIKVDGILYVAGHCRRTDCFPENFDIPGVIAYALSKDYRYPSVTIDDERGGYDMTKYLVSMGHSRIGVIGGAMDNMHTQDRCIGYQKALYEEQILYNPKLIKYGDWTRQSGYEHAGELIDEKITAIFCMNDTMAAGVYDYFLEHGLKVGEDISVVGYDNKEISDFLYPRLTTNEIQLKEIGNRATQILLDMLKSDKELPKKSEELKIPCKLILRDSVKKLIN